MNWEVEFWLFGPRSTIKILDLLKEVERLFLALRLPIGDDFSFNYFPVQNKLFIAKRLFCLR